MSWIFLVLMSLSVLAQEAVTFNGTLLEKGTRKPLKDVSIFILPHKMKAVSGDNGKFSFENILKD